MILIRKIKNKLSFFKLKLSCQISYLKNKNKFIKTIAIVSCNKWQNKVVDDILLKKRFYEKGYNAKIISWEQENNYQTYDFLIIRSIWGYQNKIEEFKNWLIFLKENNIKIYNNVNIIENNYDKERQFKILDKYNINHIKTTFVPINTNDITKYIENKTLVIKPSISGSGDNTFILNSKDIKNSLTKEEINYKLNEVNKHTSLMIQPFIKEIENGEISLIYINKKFMYAIKRYPAIFTSSNGVELIDIKFDEDLTKLVNNINNISEYQNYSYMRIDIIKVNNEYQIMELELVEPQLFFYKLNKEQLNKTIDYLIDNITNNN